MEEFDQEQETPDSFFWTIFGVGLGLIFSLGTLAAKLIVWSIVTMIEVIT
jgi:hypothetical protein